ncbi:uncharacterized protein LOC119348868 [Triticum dicoccoides]|uniref:uncharacterized protein LOC119348868 n=1 Tax=Triticum dicoccoides TaxID=85692 RepID=UPI00188F7E56|nr:uncharacterized protein LOC119348868 [Triticum dicoccoides]XP_044414455.1 uncharacterized protein LOC123138536 [Triticum aestivum]
MRADNSLVLTPPLPPLLLVASPRATVTVREAPRPLLLCIVPSLPPPPLSRSSSSLTTGPQVVEGQQAAVDEEIYHQPPPHVFLLRHQREEHRSVSSSWCSSGKRTTRDLSWRSTLTSALSDWSGSAVVGLLWRLAGGSSNPIGTAISFPIHEPTSVFLPDGGVEPTLGYATLGRGLTRAD